MELDSCLNKANRIMNTEGKINLTYFASMLCPNCRLIWDGLWEPSIFEEGTTIKDAKKKYPCLKTLPYVTKDFQRRKKRKMYLDNSS